MYGVVGNTDYSDNARRFAMLARAALKFSARSDTPPAIIHAHDWQAGLVPVYLKTLYAKHPALGGIPSVFTIHNLAYQGLFPRDWLPRLGLPLELLTMEQLEYWGRWDQLRRTGHDSQPRIRAGSPDIRVRVRLRRHPASAPRRPGRHPQRHRHGRVGSGPRPVLAGAVRGGTICLERPSRRPRCWLATDCQPTRRP